MSRLQAPVIGYTLGEQAGVGPELLARVLPALPGRVEYRPMGARVDCTPGCPTRSTAQMAWEHLERAAEALRSGEIDAVVTAPICKESLQSIGFPYPGQTEFFADRLGVQQRHAMCLTGEKLTVALCTTHVALESVASLLSTEQIVQVGELLGGFLRGLGKEAPRLAIAGLNPHNGEGGAFGRQELTLIAPAVEELRRRLPYAHISGPCVPDSVYRDAAMGGYDGIVAPYHDQALIPLKLLDFHTAVNTTLGLPRLRVSPDHGTAFALAGKGVANPSSTLHAFWLALRYLGMADLLPADEAAKKAILASLRV